MAEALSLDLRQRVMNAIAAGMSRRQATERFGVSAASAVRWQKQFSDTGTSQSDKQRGARRPKRIDARAATILAIYETTPDITLAKSKCDWLRTAYLPGSVRSGGSSTGMGSRVKKGGARGRTGAASLDAKAPGVVRKPTRPRS